MSVTHQDFHTACARIVVVGDGDSSLATGLRSFGHDVTELMPSDFHGDLERMADVVAILPECPDALRVGAVAAACAKMVWFQEQSAPDGLAELLAAAGVPIVEQKDLLAECRA